MRIENYNRDRHDIYLFNLSQLRVISYGYNGTIPILPAIPDEYSSYVDPVTGEVVDLPCTEPLPPEFVFRRRAPYIDLNSQAKDFVEGKGLTWPDWSGLTVRERGSSLNRCEVPHRNYAYGTNLYTEGFPYTNLQDYQNWNNGQPPFYLITPQHFLGCKHFVIQGSNQTITLVRRTNGQKVSYTGSPISSFGDATLYKLSSPIPHADIKAYDIVNPLTIPIGTLFWRQTPIGTYVTYYSTTETVYGGSETTLVYPVLKSYHNIDPDFPKPQDLGTVPASPGFGEGEGTVWVGDSGSPMLITHNGETYIYGASNGTNGQFGATGMWNWLRPLLAADGYNKSLVNLGATPPSFIPAISGDFYRAGFLEEMEAAGWPFSYTHPSGNPPIVDAKLSGDIPAGKVTLRKVSVTSQKLSCEVRVGDVVVLTPADFARLGPQQSRFSSNVGKHFTWHVESLNKNIFFTYVIRTDADNFSPEPIDVFELCPGVADPHCGQVGITCSEQNIASGVVSFSEGYNYNLDYNNAEYPLSCLFGVSPGAGEGLEPCPSDVVLDDVMRTFNGVGPNDKGDISIQPNSADCISVDGYYEGFAGVVKIDSHCAPCCRCSDYSDTSDYIKGVALQYYQAVNKLNELTAQYNSIAAQVKERITGCQTANRLYARLKIWPQQGFKIQVQAMAENNTRKNVRIKKLKLKLVFSIPDLPIGGISAVDPDTGVVYSMGSGQPIAVAPLKDASYLYFKNLNPVSKGFDFRAPNPGVVEFETDLTNSSSALPPAPEGGSPYDVEPCTGYAMITGAVNLVDPVFRKIVNIAYKDGLTINVRILFKYIGTPAGEDPCLDEEDGEHSILVPEGELREITAKGNQSSASPCDSVRASAVAFDTNTSTVNLRFPNQLYGEGAVEISYRVLDGSEWVEYGLPQTVQISANGESDFSLGAIPPDLADGTYQAVVRYLPNTTAAPDQQFHTRCLAIDGVSDAVAIAASDFQVGTIFNVGGA